MKNTPRFILLAVGLTLSGIVGCGGTPSIDNTLSLDCQATRNGVTVNYPCGSQEPSEPTDGAVLTAWYLGQYTANDVRQLVVERYDTTLSAEQWAEHHLGVGIHGLAPEALLVAGLPAIGYDMEGKDLFEASTSKVIVVREDDSPAYQPVFLITVTVSSLDGATKAQYSAQLQQMLDSIELPRFP